ncbi:MAG: transposase [Porticoccus sp.]
MTKSTTRKHYAPEFKEETLRLASKIGVTKVTRELGIYPSQIYGWRSAAQKKASTSKRESGLATENARLRRQLAEQAEHEPQRQLLGQCLCGKLFPFTQGGGDPI